MVDTPRSTSALQTLFASNSSGDVSAQDLRDFTVSSWNKVDDGDIDTSAKSDGYVLTWNNGTSKWEAEAAAGLSNVVEDTTPQLGGQLDVNGNALGDGTLELLKFSETALATNELTITNAASGGSPSLTATGDDTNIDLTLDGKGSGTVKTISSDIVSSGNVVVGAATTDRIAYFDGTKQILSLDTATYPSLTELSYVKGVTSAIQTQFSGLTTDISTNATNICKRRRVLCWSNACNAPDCCCAWCDCILPTCNDDVIIASASTAPTGGFGTVCAHTAFVSGTCLQGSNWKVNNFNGCNIHNCVVVCASEIFMCCSCNCGYLCGTSVWMEDACNCANSYICANTVRFGGVGSAWNCGCIVASTIFFKGSSICHCGYVLGNSYFYDAWACGSLCGDAYFYNSACNTFATICGNAYFLGSNGVGSSTIVYGCAVFCGTCSSSGTLCGGVSSPSHGKVFPVCQPSSPICGSFFYDTSGCYLQVYNGSTWNCLCRL